MTRQTRGRLTTTDCFAIFGCASTAFGLSVFLRGYELRLAAPVIFLLVIIAVAQVFNRLATILITVAAGLIFALVLFEPYGSLVVQNAVDRLVLSGFAICALAAIIISPTPASQRAGRHSPRK